MLVGGLLDEWNETHISVQLGLGLTLELNLTTKLVKNIIVTRFEYFMSQLKLTWMGGWIM